VNGALPVRWPESFKLEKVVEHYKGLKKKAENAALKRKADRDYEKDLLLNIQMKGKSLFCLSKDHWFRQQCFWLANHLYFENFIMLTSLVSCGFLAYENPSTENSPVIAHSHLVINSIFMFEMVVKVVGLGFHWGNKIPNESDPQHFPEVFVWENPYCYLRNSWNILDFFVVIVGWVAFFLPHFKPLRAFRVVIACACVAVSISGMPHACRSEGNILFIFIYLSIFVFILSYFFWLKLQMLLNKRCFFASFVDSRAVCRCASSCAPNASK
jgi:hypothetical protein